MRPHLLRLGLTAILTAALLSTPAVSAYAAQGCSTTAVKTSECGYTADGMAGAYGVTSLKWAITFNGKTVLSSAKGSRAIGKIKPGNGVEVLLVLLGPGTGVIAS